MKVETQDHTRGAAGVPLSISDRRYELNFPLGTPRGPMGSGCPPMEISIHEKRIYTRTHIPVVKRIRDRETANRAGSLSAKHI